MLRLAKSWFLAPHRASPAHLSSLPGRVGATRAAQAAQFGMSWGRWQIDPGELQFPHSSCHAARDQAKHNYTCIASPPQPIHITLFPSSPPYIAWCGRLWFHPALLILYQLPAQSCIANLASPPSASALPSPGSRRLQRDTPMHQHTEEQEPLLLALLLSSPLGVTRKSPRFCCQSIFDSSANLTLFSSL